MKILVVEDDVFKREIIENFLKARNIEVLFKSFFKPALTYVLWNPDEVSGIILGALKVRASNSIWAYDWLEGFELIERLNFEKKYIPVLINSDIDVNIEAMKSIYEFVKGQMSKADDYAALGEFITLL